jgi:hypothetical protein
MKLCFSSYASSCAMTRARRAGSVKRSNMATSEAGLTLAGDERFGAAALSAVSRVRLSSRGRHGSQSLDLAFRSKPRLITRASLSTADRLRRTLALCQSPVPPPNREAVWPACFPTGPPSMRRSRPNCGWLRRTPSSSCATARLAAGTTASPVVECQPILPVGEDLQMGSVLTTTTTATTTINPAKTSTRWVENHRLPRPRLPPAAVFEPSAALRWLSPSRRAAQCVRGTEKAAGEGGGRLAQVVVPLSPVGCRGVACWSGSPEAPLC